MWRENTGSLEVRFRNDQVYLLKTHDITTLLFEDQISQFKYNDLYEGYKQIKDEFGAEKIHLPAMNIVFYEYIFTTGNAISPKDFIDIYLDYYKTVWIRNGDQIEFNRNTYSVNTIAGRILRAYPSLIRDFDFFLLCVESGRFEQVIYSCAQDINGKDIIIKHKGQQYDVSLFVNTNRSNYFKRIKNLFRHNYSKNEIKIPLNLEKARQCGDFMLYSYQDVENMAKIIAT